MTHPAHQTAPPARPRPGGDEPVPPRPPQFLRGMQTRRFVLTALRQLLPSLLVSVVCTLIVYSLLRPHFPPSSIMPLLVASLCPVLGNVLSLVRQHRLDIFGVMVLIGLVVSIIGVLLGGGPRLLLLRESFVTGASGLALLVSLLWPRPPGYYFARQLLTANDPAAAAWFGALWQYPPFQRHVGRNRVLGVSAVGGVHLAGRDGPYASSRRPRRLAGAVQCPHPGRCGRECCLGESRPAGSRTRAASVSPA